jgi:hypothetical protein
MTISMRLTAFLLVVASSACFLFAHETNRLQPPPEAPVEVRLGCALAETRCTRCHSVDRIISARIVSPTHWQAYVRRMRLQPQSGILPDEERPILQCMVYRSFGASGLASLPPETTIHTGSGTP